MNRRKANETLVVAVFETLNARNSGPGRVVKRCGKEVMICPREEGSKRGRRTSQQRLCKKEVGR